MSSDASRRVHERVRELARDYESRGYRVLIGPDRHEQPEFLRGLEPDLIATRGDDRVVVEVTTRSELRREKLSRIARAVETTPGWRLELVLTNPRAQHDERTPLEPSEIKSRIEFARSAAAVRGESSAAIVVLWTAAEAILRHLVASRSGASVSPQRLVKEAFALGEISKKDQQWLDEFAGLRNAAAHGMSIPPVSVATLDRYIAGVKRLLEALRTRPGD